MSSRRQVLIVRISGKLSGRLITVEAAQLAAATGMYFHDNNDLLSGLRRAFNDERERCLIAYTPSNGGFHGKYRTIRVEVKDKALEFTQKPVFGQPNFRVFEPPIRPPNSQESEGQRGQNESVVSKAI